MKKKINYYKNNSTNITELNNIVYKGAKLSCDKIGIPRENLNIERERKFG